MCTRNWYAICKGYDTNPIKMLHENLIDHLLQIKEIYLEPEVYKYKCGLEILEKYSDAKLTEVASHWKIPELFGFEGSVDDWISNKRHVLILGAIKSLIARPNFMSSHWIASSEFNGCIVLRSFWILCKRKLFASNLL